MLEFKSFSAEDTERIAAEISEELSPKDVVCLYGEMGVGKTFTFHPKRKSFSHKLP